MAALKQEHGLGRPGELACVLGLGRSGLAAARLLINRGLKVRGLDRQATDELRTAWAPLGADGAELITGEHPLTALENCALIIRSPGIPMDIPFLDAARERNIPVRSELQLAAAEIKTPMLAITGTNGKSTTTAWTAHLLCRAGRSAVAAGNIGRALSQAVLDVPAETIFVVEVSSFQLEDSPGFHPAAACLLNITPDHLDRHGTLEAYTAAKWSIASRMSANDSLVLGPGLNLPSAANETALPWQGAGPALVCCDVDAESAKRAIASATAAATGAATTPATTSATAQATAPAPAKGACFTVIDGTITRCENGILTPILAVDEVSLPGPHNLVNAMVALALANHVVDDLDGLAAGLRDFPGLVHRLEEVGRIDGVRMINDSKSTNVDSLRVALQSYPGQIVLIAGGRDKQGPFEELTSLVKAKVGHLVAIGEAAARLQSVWSAVSSQRAADLDSAIDAALAAAPRDGVVLFSPGCASFDMFKNFEERGDVFRRLVQRRIEGQTKTVNRMERS